ncbi:integral membrane protein [Xylariaceae sp. FL0662B]|nr:integral membrane protein [Xylariaceae sp. FL0662B]
MGYRGDLIAAMVVFLILDGAAVAARLYVRTRMLTRGLGWDDFVLCLTFLAYVLMCGMGFASMAYGYAAEDLQPYYSAAKAKRFYFANQITLYIAAGLVKIAVALVLYRLASTRGLRWTIVASMVVVGIWTIVMTVFAADICAQGGSSNWAGSETCTQIGYFRTITNIFIDYFYALLPVFMLRKVKMNLRMKVSVLLLLGLGVFASSATIVKLVIIVRLSTAKGAEAEGLHYDLLLWADIELGLATFAAAAAALRPLLKYIPVMWSKSRTAKSRTSDAVGPYQELEAASEMGRVHKTPTRSDTGQVASDGALAV